MGNFLINLKQAFFKDKKLDYKKLLALMVVFTLVSVMISCGDASTDQVSEVLQIAEQFFKISEEVIE